ncbi:tyrosine-type recombinase/integrase [Halomicrobium mukohataei]|uniref:Tyrosine-type recombinase/integrase n=1 Tax=Halomicrobium mukohataei TaxID=57705 RepID=A0A847U8J8_9EURY|nr:site-specific integrase [Halomicrobium mukohataei]NLV09309.1 tyrosine-type recombinase/integrase [Halomicrobium mukohataei]
MIRIDDSGKRTKCWLSYPDEVRTLEQYARDRDWEQEIAIQLMARVGSRASGVVSAKPKNLRWNSDGEYWELTLKGKNTKGGEKTVRDAYVPTNVKENLDRYASERGIDEDEPYVQKSTSRIRAWVREITDEIAEESGQKRWYEVSSHDLRRSWATHHLVEENRAVRVMMEVGGWSSYDAIEPYLTKPTPEKIGAEFSD